MTEVKEERCYYPFSEYLKKTYGEKVYKLPINLPITCPNRIHKDGCTFCAEVGTGFESLNHALSVREQIQKNKTFIQKKYHANKFLAYFQNYTNTYLPLEQFKAYILEACGIEDVIGISISTRPDCIEESYLDFLKEISENFHLDITIELGLQTANYKVLDRIERGHGLAAFIASSLLIENYGFTQCAHVILNLPGTEERDVLETANILAVLPVTIAKVHSLYIAKNSRMEQEWKDGKFEICTKEEYFHYLKTFLTHIPKEMPVERLFSRIPKEDSVFSNWNTSWWKLQEEFEQFMKEKNNYQGQECVALNSRALVRGGLIYGSK